MGKAAADRQHESGFFEENMPETKKRQAARSHHKAAAAAEAAEAAELARHQLYNRHSKVRSSNRRQLRESPYVVAVVAPLIEGPSFSGGHRSRYVESDDDEDENGDNNSDVSDEEDNIEQNRIAVDANGGNHTEDDEDVSDQASEEDDEEEPLMETICLDSDEDGEFNS